MKIALIHKVFIVFFSFLLVLPVCTSGQNSFPKWELLNLAEKTDVMFVQFYEGKLYAGFGGEGIHYSEDGGKSWNPISDGRETAFSNCILFTETNWYCGTLFSGVFRSTDQGKHWEPVNEGLNTRKIYALEKWANALWAGGANGIYTSENDGGNWKKTTLPYPLGAHQSIFTFLNQSEGIYAGSDGAVLFSEDKGVTWHQDSLLHRFEAYSILAKSDTIITGLSGKGILSKMESGIDWMQVQEPQVAADAGNISGLGYWKDSLFVKTTANAGVFINGVAVNEGLTDLGIRSLCILDDKLMVGTVSSGIWQLVMTDTSSSSRHSIVSSGSNESFLTIQPNPASDHIFIQYGHQNEGFIRIELRNDKGQLLDIPVQATLGAGAYNKRVDLSTLQEGVYFFSMIEANRIITREFVVIW